MVAAQRVADPNIVPVPPEWLRRQQEASPASANVNINDIYWRKPDGWIVVGPSAVPGNDGRPLTRQAEGLIRKGWEPLIEYSYTNRISSKTGQKETIEVTADRLGTEDRYYWLFVNGGAHLFSIEQIVEHHWHIKPPFGLPLSVFPQLDEWDVPEPYFCPACPGERPPKNSAEQVTTHLMIEHRLTIQQARDLETQNNGFRDRPQARTGLAIRRKTQQMEAENEAQGIADGAPSPDQPKGRLRVCNSCGEAITGRLADHVCAPA